MKQRTHDKGLADIEDELGRWHYRRVRVITDWEVGYLKLRGIGMLTKEELHGKLGELDRHIRELNLQDSCHARHCTHIYLGLIVQVGSTGRNDVSKPRTNQSSIALRSLSGLMCNTSSKAYLRDNL